MNKIFCYDAVRSFHPLYRRVFSLTANLIRMALAVVVLSNITCSTEDEPTAPTGTNLTGEWISSIIKYTDSDKFTVTTRLHFLVNSNSTEIIRIEEWPTTPTQVIGLICDPCKIQIVDGRFQYLKPNPLSNNSNHKISGAFRTSNKADGDWYSDVGPPGYRITGAGSIIVNQKWTATR